MLYHQFKDTKISVLGLGAMRLPLIPGGGPGDIDQERVNEMVDYALANGINYFDTAKAYHAGHSEICISKALSRHPREQWFLADKFPGHQVAPGLTMSPEEVFNEQLEACGVDYFDFYLIHNVNEHSRPFYFDQDNGVVEYFVKMREEGKIKHLGFSTHAGVECLRDYLDKYGDYMEFCQMQVNFVDWDIQDAEIKCRMLAERGIDVWVMEGVRGGRLLKLDDSVIAEMKAMRPDETPAAWAFRWIQTVVKPMITLSGMSNMEQLIENIKTFSDERPLNEAELEVIQHAKNSISPFIPCTRCGECRAVCPKKLDIPLLLSICNDMRVQDMMDPVGRYDAQGERTPDTCIECGACVAVCPEHNDLPAMMKELVKRREGKKSWIAICYERDAADKAIKAAKAAAAAENK